MLVVLWNAFLRGLGHRGWLVLVMAAVFPGAVYGHAIFPISLALLGLVLAAVATREERWALAGLAGAGVALVLSPASWSAIPGRGDGAAPGRGRSGRRCSREGWSPCGFAVVPVLHQVLLGHWESFYWVHRKGFPAMAHPMETFLAVVTPAFSR